MTEYDTDVHRRLSQLSAADGQDLLSLAVPPDGALGEVRERVQADHAEADYIDDGSTRPERAALEAARGVLSDYETVPESGLVIYTGVVEGESGVVEYVFDDLPAPVPEDVYERGNEFVTDPLEAVVGTNAVHGLVVVERGGAALGRLSGEAVTPLASFDSGVMGKTRAGGQSAERFARRREEQTDSFFQDVADEAERLFLEDGDVDGLLLGGTEVTVDRIREGEYLPAPLDDRLLATFSVEYAAEQGLRELARTARDEREEFERQPAETALEAFFERLATDDDPVAYGAAATHEALEYDAADTVLVSADIRPVRIRTLEERAAATGADVHVVPPDVERADRFRVAFGGVAAILRFAVE